MLELPTNRAEYVGMLQDMGDYPRRSPIGHRVPSDSEVDELQRGAGRWRAMALLEDERALCVAAALFSREFVLDPFFDNGAMLYAAWHDPLIRDEHSRRLAEQAGLLVRCAPLLNCGSAVLAPDHLPGSWNPRPGWRKPRPSDNPRQLAGWAMRSALTLVYWADRLNALVVTTRSDVVAALDVVLGERVVSYTVDLAEPSRVDEAAELRALATDVLVEAWSAANRLGRRRKRTSVEDIAETLSAIAVCETRRTWRLSLGSASVPEPTLLIRRVLMGEDPERAPALPRRKLKRPILGLLAV